MLDKYTCGCGKEVNTPLLPTGWKLLYDGESISLKPSVGNWSFDCKSHYWITNSEIEWSLTWTDDKIKRIREEENDERYKHYESKKPIPTIIGTSKKDTSKEQLLKKKWWLMRVFFGDRFLLIGCFF